MWAFLALLTFAASFPGVFASYVADLTLLTDSLARCLDGTPGGFFWLPASGSSSETKWVISLQGGGECADVTSCTNALTSSLGSSKYFPKSYDMSGEWAQFNQASAGSTPFATWNHVRLEYCTQDLWTGLRKENSPEAYDMYFAGHLIFRAVLDSLDAGSPSLKDAREIILTGESAGGIGVWPNLDYLAERYPNARVVAAPIAGHYFYAYPYAGANHTASGLADFRPEAWEHHYGLWDSFVDASCQTAHALDPWFCLLSNNSLPFIASEAFVIEAQTDQVVLLYHDSVPQPYLQQAPEQAYLEEWHKNMTEVALAPFLDLANERIGAFNPACFIHTSFNLTMPLIDGVSYMTAFYNFYFRDQHAVETGTKTKTKTETKTFKLKDSCGLMCNPTCPN